MTRGIPDSNEQLYHRSSGVVIQLLLYVTCHELELINHPTSRPPFLNDYSIDSNFDLISSYVSKVTMFLSLKFRA